MVIIITKNFNIPVKDFDAKKYAGYSKMLVVTELRVSGLGTIP